MNERQQIVAVMCIVEAIFMATGHYALASFAAAGVLFVLVLTHQSTPMNPYIEEKVKEFDFAWRMKEVICIASPELEKQFQTLLADVATALTDTLSSYKAQLRK